MEINLLDRIELVHGAAEVVAGENGFSLLRMTRELAEFYGGSEAVEVRTNCPSGVRICFRSDTSFVGMRLNYGRPAREVYAIDLVIDGIERLTFVPQSVENGFAFNAELPGGGGAEHTIELHMPHLCECTVEELVIEDGATLAPLKFTGGRMIFIGDSITQGMVSSSPARAYTALLATGLKRDFHNLCVGGAVMRHEVGRMALDLSWKAAVVAFGVNDCSQQRTLEAFMADTRGMFEALTSRSEATVYALTPIPWPASPPDRNLEDFRDVIRIAASKFDRVQVIEGTDLVPDDSRFFIDGCHPNDAGMQAYAENLLEQIRRLESAARK
jgi:lysophospholipase L1-like esterase